MEEIGAVEVGWHENAWKRSAKRGPLGSIWLFFFRAGRSPLVVSIAAVMERQTCLQVTLEIKILGRSLKEGGAISVSQLGERSSKREVKTPRSWKIYW